MSLVQIATSTVTSAVSTVTLTGIDSDNSYMIAISNAQPATDNAQLKVRFTVGGSADTSSNYDFVYKKLRSDTTFSDFVSTNDDILRLSSSGLGTDTSETDNIILYLYNFNNSSQYSFVTALTVNLTNGQGLRGNAGGAVLTKEQATDGVEFRMVSGDIASGVFTLYKII
tara:strand:- start:1710 stop:2219 length:510 start_codon:yes stop_codon:yes gene_type:complete